MKDKIKLRGDWTFTLVDKISGKIISKETIKNTIVNVGLERMAKLLNGQDTTYFRAIAIGTDNTAVTATDTALGTEFDRALATLSYVSNYKAKFTKTFTFGSGVSTTIYEAGIFDSDVASGSVMLNRVVVSPGKDVSSTIDLIVEAEITFAGV